VLKPELEHGDTIKSYPAESIAVASSARNKGENARGVLRLRVPAKFSLSRKLSLMASD
jgi:hypothetical protein